MSKINTLELKFYPNVQYHLDQLSEKEKANVKHVSENEIKILTGKNVYTIVKNFDEYYIDGKPLNQELKKHYSKTTKDNNSSTNVLNGSIGWIGAFDAIFDWVLMKEFLLEELKTEELVKNFPFKRERVEQIVEYREEYKNEKYQTLYGCPCGDEECGGFGVIVTKENGFYTWTFGEGENQLQFRFEENQYRTAFQKALAEIRLKSKNQ